jgi:hypothetical protein
MKLRILGTTSFSLFFLLSGFVHAQAPPTPTDAPSPLSAIVHDFTNWLDHLGTDVDHHRASHSPPLPRPRPAELASAVASNQELSEFAPAPVASKKKTPTPVQIRD